MKILIIQIARIGDLIMTSSLIAGLKEKYGVDDAQIDVLVSKPFAETAEGIPGINKIWSISLSEITKPINSIPSFLITSYGIIRQLCQGLRQERYDLALNITHTDYSAFVTRLVEAKKSLGITLDDDGEKIVNGGWAKYYFNAFINRRLNPFHVVDIHLKMADVNLRQNLSYIIHKETQRQADEIIREVNPHGQKLIAVIPGASASEKMWGTEKISRVLSLINAKQKITGLIFGSAGDNSLAEQITGSFPEAVNMTGKTSIALLAGMLKRCDLALTNDTGPMHLAAVVGTKTIDISLGSAYANETAPYGDGHIVVEPVIDCHPCDARHKCEHQSCHARISPDVVADLAFGVLGGDKLSERRIPNQKCRIFLTGFAEDGKWRLNPLRSEDRREETQLLQAYRNVWENSLDKPLSSGTLGTFDLKVFWEKNAEDSDGDIKKQIAKRIDGQGSFLDIIRIGENAAEELARYGEIDADLEMISHLSIILSEVDKVIIERAYQNPVIMPLVSQFTLEKDAVRGEDLKTLSVNTVRLYRDFGLRLSQLTDAIDNTSLIDSYFHSEVSV